MSSPNSLLLLNSFFDFGATPEYFKRAREKKLREDFDLFAGDEDMLTETYQAEESLETMEQLYNHEGVVNVPSCAVGQVTGAVKLTTGLQNKIRGAFQKARQMLRDDSDLVTVYWPGILGSEVWYGMPGLQPSIEVYQCIDDEFQAFRNDPLGLESSHEVGSGPAASASSMDAASKSPVEPVLVAPAISASSLEPYKNGAAGDGTLDSGPTGLLVGKGLNPPHNGTSGKPLAAQDPPPQRRSKRARKPSKRVQENQQREAEAATTKKVFVNTRKKTQKEKRCVIHLRP